MGEKYRPWRYFCSKTTVRLIAILFSIIFVSCFSKATKQKLLLYERNYHILIMGRTNTKSPAKKATKKSSNSSGVTSQDRIVQAIASRNGFGDMKPTRKMIMGMALMTNKRSFDTTLLNIKKKKGFLEYDKNSVWLTKDGIDYVGPNALSVPDNNDAMQAKIRNEMVKGQKPRQIFDLMLDGGWHTRAELAEALEMENNKSFGTYISSLSKLVERENRKIRLGDMVFPCGRPSP
jgi:hypothetical protein